MNKIDIQIKEAITRAPLANHEICKKCKHFDMTYSKKPYPKREWENYAVFMMCAKSYMTIEPNWNMYVPNRLGHYIMVPSEKGAGTTFGYIRNNGEYRPNKKAFVPDSCPYRLEHLLETEH